jgi:hypothetical protein
METFDFSKEMVYGNKHLCKLRYDIKKYKFIEYIEKLFTSELNNLHNIQKREYELFTEVGKDSNTEFHKKFYKRLDEGWDIQDEYDKFIKNEVLPFLGLNEAMVQKFPTLRVMLPNNVAIVLNHHDSDELHGHPKCEINFIMGLTNMYDTNAVNVETIPRLEKYEKINLNAGETICFNGNLCNHNNEINKTGKTRVSFDFRILPLNYYDENYNKSSASTNTKYVEGGYYKRVKVDNVLFKARDIWDKEKEAFNGVMLKYGVQDAWGVVNLFEQKMAEYAGSKYAVSVDNCTDALFLCLKYLKARGKVIIPSKTWISVPCTIKHAGCEVEFEDREWSGAYQLKPYPIYDGAVRMKRGMYKPNTYHCLSFHIRKHIPIGKGGMILLDDKEAYDWFRTVRYEGRTIGEDGVNYMLYKDDPIKSMGWNMYMTPEQAARGLELFENIKQDNPDQESSGTCKDLSKLDIY